MRWFVLLSFLLVSAHAAAQSTADRLPANERAALLQLYDATDGDHWTKKEGWKSDAPPCTWFGVFCLADDGDLDVDHVSILFLGDNNLHGELPPALAQLSHLRTLEVLMNDLHGPIPEPLLERWDRNELALYVWPGTFSNAVASVRIEVQSGSLRCISDQDINYFVELSGDGKAHFESVRCGRGDSEYRLIRDGEGPSLLRLARAWKRLHADDLRNYASAITHAKTVRISVRFGDGATKETESYGEENPLDFWMTEQIVFGLVHDVRWKSEHRQPIVTR